MRSFASDNNSGIHPLVLKAIEDANKDHAMGYGEDEWTNRAVTLIKEVFGPKADPYFVFNGTGANSVALRACTRTFNSIIAAESAHIFMDECGAPVFQTGCQIKEIVTRDGKLTPELIREKLVGFGAVHQSQPKVVYISECTEYGTVYTPKEIKAIADLIHKYGMYLHVDGARLANAAAYLGVTLKELTADCDVDILSFGGTKNGMMLGEAVISFRPELSENMKYIRKQSGQLYSKLRYTSCQFLPYLTNELWRKNALHANKMAQLLVKGIREICDVEFSQKVEANIVLMCMPRKVIEKLQQKYVFYIWNEITDEMRLVTSFDTTPEDVHSFLEDLKDALKEFPLKFTVNSEK